MTKLIVEIPENEVAFFTSLVNKFNYSVNPFEEKLYISETDQNLIDSRRVNATKENLSEWKVFKNELVEKYDL
jgi:hypothetical protein